MGSEDFINAKKLIYDGKFDITKVNINFTGPANPDKTKKDNATIVFAKNGDEKTISSEESDFIMLACHIQSTFRDGNKKLIEIKDTNKYYENVEHFIPKADNDIKEAVKRLKTGKHKIPPNFNLYNSFAKLINKEFKDDEVRLLVKNYFEVVGTQIITLESVYKHFELVKQKLLSNNQRFKAFMEKIDKIIRENVLNHNPLKSVEIFVTMSKTDAELLIKNITHLEKTSFERWKALSNNGKQGIEGKSAAKYMVDDYNDYFEILQKILRDLAVFINSNTKDFESVDTFYQIDSIFKKNGYSDLVSPIVVKLRHSGTHWDIDYSNKGKVSIYDTHSKDKKLIFEIDYKKLIEKTQKLRDLTWAAFFSYYMWREIIFFRCLDSPELKFYLVENIKE